VEARGDSGEVMEGIIGDKKLGGRFRRACITNLSGQRECFSSRSFIYL
jgi:hypothetical protein